IASGCFCPSSSRKTPRMKHLAACVRICMFYCSMCLAGWPVSSEAARRRCGSELLSDLIFVCGDRGIYLGKGSWSGYGPRPRGKGIVDQCCKSSGCELQYLETYCAKPKTKELAPTSTTTTTTTSHTFQAVFQKRLLEHVGAPDSPKRDAYRRETQPSFPRRGNASSPRRRTDAQISTSRPPLASEQLSSLHRTL
uniref:Insulin-like domain-containing protein n=1 Tax=Kryptolebias marmoratus TaxID=37003 RepID=A0A3Q3APG9_KRYMA